MPPSQGQEHLLSKPYEPHLLRAQLVIPMASGHSLGAHRFHQQAKERGAEPGRGGEVCVKTSLPKSNKNRASEHSPAREETAGTGRCEGGSSSGQLALPPAPSSTRGGEAGTRDRAGRASLEGLASIQSGFIWIPLVGTGLNNSTWHRGCSRPSSWRRPRPRREEASLWAPLG